MIYIQQPGYDRKVLSIQPLAAVWQLLVMLERATIFFFFVYRVDCPRSFVRSSVVGSTRKYPAGIVVTSIVTCSCLVHLCELYRPMLASATHVDVNFRQPSMSLPYSSAMIVARHMRSLAVQFNTGVFVLL